MRLLFDRLLTEFLDFYQPSPVRDARLHFRRVRNNIPGRVYLPPGYRGRQCTLELGRHLLALSRPEHVISHELAHYTHFLCLTDDEWGASHKVDREVVALALSDHFCRAFNYPRLRPTPWISGTPPAFREALSRFYASRRTCLDLAFDLCMSRLKSNHPTCDS